ncbi:MAG TPA: DUF4956 domain-containing protein [Candidatus Hydrogenedentes bacterium]|nr:DUF4956 domain-containing protein [Candidatus Hydrogenedentota bacterium]HPG69837.1 DUF4956 domain-containing protein [Candidatus Hydrogenedentota bacterium]
MNLIDTLSTLAPMDRLTVGGTIVGLLLAFVLGQLAAWVYMYTHSGLSYSRSFVQAVVLLTMIVTLSMMVIANNVVVALGLIGALAVVRFRNILKDTRDTAFVFFALVVGMAVGIGAYSVAVLGTVILCIVILYMYWSQFGSRRSGDALLRFQVAVGETDHRALHAVLHRHCRRAHLMSQRFPAPDLGELAYRLTMRNPTLSDRLVQELEAMQGVSQLTFFFQEDETEV